MIKVTNELGVKCSFCDNQKIGKNISMVFMRNHKSVVCAQCVPEIQKVMKEGVVTGDEE